jgi:xylose isomerase
VQTLLAEINADDGSMSGFFGKYTAGKAEGLKKQSFDRAAISARGLKYERLDQLTIDIITGTR